MDRSELLRAALRRHLLRRPSEDDARRWSESPLDEGEQSLSQIADWGPTEDWADWAEAAGPSVSVPGTTQDPTEYVR